MSVLTLFLSLDGVLHPRSTFIDKRGVVRCLAMGATPFQWHMHLLRIAEAHDVQVVICSHWLQKMSLNQLRVQAPAWMRPRIVGACAQFERLNELQLVTRLRPMREVAGEYARSHGLRAWVALDVAAEGSSQHADVDDRVVRVGVGGLSDPIARKQLNDALIRERARVGRALKWPRILSLDFDGVLHPLGTGTTTISTTHFGWLPVLERLLAAHPDVRVLVHSSWREAYRPEELQMLIGPLEKRFVGAAPMGQRYESVLWWLQMNPAYSSYRILDDDATEFPDPLPDELVLCDPLQGVSDPLVQAQLRSWLENSNQERT
jgi:hypothetical protein